MLNSISSIKVCLAGKCLYFKYMLPLFTPPVWTLHFKLMGRKLMLFSSACNQGQISINAAVQSSFHQFCCELESVLVLIMTHLSIGFIFISCNVPKQLRIDKLILSFNIQLTFHYWQVIF